MKTYLSVRLPMYDWPEVRDATAELEMILQCALLDELGAANKTLPRLSSEASLESEWLHPQLLLSQTCGYPLTHALRGRVSLIGALDYAADGCEGPDYCSQILVRNASGHQRLDDLRGMFAVFNGLDSQSGMNVFRREVAEIADGGKFFKEVTKTGSHRNSMKAVAYRNADVACVDTVSWWLACKEAPDLAGQLRSIGRTRKAPGLPLVTAGSLSAAEVKRIADVVADVLSLPSTAKSRERLGIRGFSKLSLGAYEEILHMEREAIELGYPNLA